MQSRLAIILLLASSLGCGSSTDVTKSETTLVEFNAAGAPTVQFEIPDMVCESCTEAVQKTLASQTGAKEVKADLETKLATVAIDESTFDKEAALAALFDKQFSQAKLVTAPEKPAEPAAPAAPAEPEHKDDKDG